MNEIANTAQATLAPLDDLAMQAQMFSCGAAMNLLQLGRVLTEAKPLVSHGAWEEWVRTNAHMPVRTAQQYMQAYRTFGLNQRYAQLGPSQIIKLLPMTEEEREKLLQDNDVENMTTREIDEAIRAQREKIRAEAMADAQGAIAEAKEARAAAERKAAALEAQEPEIPAELLQELQARKEEAAQSRAELERVTQCAKDCLDEAIRLRKENAQLARDMQEQEDILRDQQEAMNRTREELLNLKSAQARGDAARPTGDELTLDVFGQAVREFMGLVARMPYMQTAFGNMPQEDKQRYAELLRTVEGWATGARQALDSYCVEGEIIVE